MELTMATSTLPASMDLAGPDDGQPRGNDSKEATIHTILVRLASLKITVTVLVMAIMLVVAGTLAQVDQDVFQVVDDYFRHRWRGSISRCSSRLPSSREYRFPMKFAFPAAPWFPSDSTFRAAG